MPTQDIPQDHPQRVLAQLLVGCLNESGQPHDVVLGTLLSLYLQLALKHPCCLAESVRLSRDALAKISAAAVAAAPRIDEQDPHSVQRALVDHILHWLATCRVPVGVGLDALLSLYRHIALDTPQVLGSAAMATSTVAGELLSRSAALASRAAASAPAAGAHPNPLH
jgi:hypothetical protein